MKQCIYDAAFRLEELSCASRRWVYNKPRKLLLHHWLTDGLLSKQAEAEAAFKDFLLEVEQNAAHLSGKGLHAYLNKVKEILSRRIRSHKQILDEQHKTVVELKEQVLQLNNGTTYQSIAWNRVYDIVSREVQEVREVREACEEGKDCDGCDNCQYWPDSVFIDQGERYWFRIYYTISVGATELWLIGLQSINDRLEGLLPSEISRVHRRKVLNTKEDSWKGILTSKFTIDDLNHLLVHVGILNDINGLVLSGWATKGFWPGIFEALVDASVIPPIENKTKLYKAIIYQYGPDAASQRTIGNYNVRSKSSSYFYKAVGSFLIKRKG